MTSKYSKIWLSIIIDDGTKSTVIIHNIPFNVSDYSDVTIVLRQSIDCLKYSISGIKNITFKFIMEKEVVISYNSTIINILLLSWTIVLTLVVVLIFFDVDMLLDEPLRDTLCKDINLSDNPLNLKEKSANSNKLNPFIILFQKDSTSHYFPSYFLPSNINTASDDFNLLEYILYQQYHVLSIHSILTNEYIDSVHDIINQYKNLNERTIECLSNAMSRDYPFLNKKK